MKVDPVVPGRANADNVVAGRSAEDSLATLRVPTLQSPVSSHQFVEVFQQIINGLPEQIALVDEKWTILTVNDAWTKTAAMYGYFTLRPGTNYFEFLLEKMAEGHASAAPVVEGIAAMEAGNQDSFRFLYHGSDRWEGHTFQLCVQRLKIDGRQFATVTRYDVTELVRLRQLREGYSHDIIEGQAEERRRIGREIHDSTMQLLAGLGLAIGQLKRTNDKHEQALDIVSEMEQLLGEAQGEIRAISYLAHPPMVPDLSESLRMLVEGYGRRAGLRVSLDISSDIKVEWQAAAVAMYRVVQEALSNIHRHSQATDVAVSLFRRRSLLHVVILDNGVGMPVTLNQGVGLPSMRARLGELGGRLAVRRAQPGTMLIATLPIESSLRATGDLMLQS